MERNLRTPFHVVLVDNADLAQMVERLLRKQNTQTMDFPYVESNSHNDTRLKRLLKINGQLYRGHRDFCSEAKSTCHKKMNNP